MNLYIKYFKLVTRELSASFKFQNNREHSFERFSLTIELKGVQTILLYYNRGEEIFHHSFLITVPLIFFSLYHETSFLRFSGFEISSIVISDETGELFSKIKSRKKYKSILLILPLILRVAVFRYFENPRFAEAFDYPGKFEIPKNIDSNTSF